MELTKPMSNPKVKKIKGWAIEIEGKIYGGIWVTKNGSSIGLKPFNFYETARIFKRKYQTKYLFPDIKYIPYEILLTPPPHKKI